MIYIYDKDKLEFKKITNNVIYLTIGIIITFSICLSSFTLHKLDNTKYLSQETKAIIIKEHNEFSREKLKELLVSLNIKYPHIVMAQAEIETGGFTSRIFRENNNLFGMKVARCRPTTNLGEQNGHANYKNWTESVFDYAFYSATNLKDIYTEKDYLEYLRQNYAEDPNYVAKIKAIIKTQSIN